MSCYTARLMSLAAIMGCWKASSNGTDTYLCKDSVPAASFHWCPSALTCDTALDDFECTFLAKQNSFAFYFPHRRNEA